MPQGVYAWSKTAASNSNADSSINWAEGQAPSSVNDSARAVMARVAEYRDDTSGSITTAGTLTAYTAASNQVFASLVLMDKKSLVIIPHVTSGASPTLNVDGLGAKPLRASTGAALAAGAFIAGTPYSVTYYNTAGEFLCDGAAIADGDISTANIADKAVTAAKIADATITAAQIAPGTIGGAAVAASFVPFNTVMLNGTIQATPISGNNLQIAIKTLAGTDPTATDPVTFMFRNQSAALGNYVVRTLAASLALTVPVGAAIGFLNNVPGRFWILALDNAGVVELAVFNATGLLAPIFAGAPVGVSNIYPLHSFGSIGTQLIGGGANAGVAYAAAVRGSLSYVPLGYASWEIGGLMATAGTWNVPPSRLQVFQPGSSPLPGATIQTSFSATGVLANGANTTGFINSNAVPQSNQGDQFLTGTIAPNSSANVLTIDAALNLASAAATGRLNMAVFQDAGVNALVATSLGTGVTSVPFKLTTSYQMQAGTTAATVFKARGGSANAGTPTVFNGDGAASQLFGGTYLSSIRITEVMG